MTSRFDSGVGDDLIADLARLKQDGTLLDYLERFGTLLARVGSVGFKFFPFWANIRIRKISQGA